MKSLVSAQKSKPAWFGAETKIVDLSKDSVHALWPPPYRHVAVINTSTVARRSEEHFSAEEKAERGCIPVIIP